MNIWTNSIVLDKTKQRGLVKLVLTSQKNVKFKFQIGWWIGWARSEVLNGFLGNISKIELQLKNLENIPSKNCMDGYS